ncbi:hypothetical protein [Lysobacter capsici]|uniref:hypothetical protein n=1 Tax=Lysobacter capsici TaxID=435897 RepID=UPI001C00796C|nr:hypothetical protein [Lysobacter capsici]QWF16988.1 hypothetical protein KME82_25205 [Lysobacter capsici]
MSDSSFISKPLRASPQPRRQAMGRRVALLALGFLLAPLVPAVVLAAASPGLGVEPGDIASLLPIAAILYFPSALFVGVFGIAIFIFLWRLNLIRWWSAVLSGFASGVLLSSVVGDFRWMRSGLFMAELPALLVWGACGAASGLIIWLSWKAGTAFGLDRPVA